METISYPTSVGETEVERIWKTIQHALDQHHGMAVVISKDPISEIARLGQEALAINPEYLDYKDVVRLGRVDGAIMLGADGRCYAFGVILDGLATSTGDRSRGARFNSSVRYQQTSKIGTMVVVISDDGTVDLVPNLMPRIWRQTVEDAVKSFCGYSGIEADAQEWARRDQQIEALRFYLNEDQCKRVNGSYEKEMRLREQLGMMSVTRNPLKPDPDMNDSYFFDS